MHKYINNVCVRVCVSNFSLGTLCKRTFLICLKHRFKSKYHPEEFAKRQEEIRSSLQNRMSVFLELFTTGRLDNVYVDVDKSEDILKVLDAGIYDLFCLTLIPYLFVVRAAYVSHFTTQLIKFQLTFDHFRIDIYNASLLLNVCIC